MSIVATDTTTSGRAGGRPAARSSRAGWSATPAGTDIVQPELRWDELEWLDPTGTRTQGRVGDPVDTGAGWASQGCSHWVLAAPFRAHVQHLIATSGLAWRTLALLAGVPAAAMHRLLHGRGRRRQHRIHPVLARRLFQLTVEDLAAARTQTMPANVCRAALNDLGRAGWTGSQIARRANLSPALVNAIASDRQPHCTRSVGATILAAAQALTGAAPAANQPSRQVAAA
jgi:hypothetical protein